MLGNTKMIQRQWKYNHSALCYKSKVLVCILCHLASNPHQKGTMERHVAVTYLDPNCLKVTVYLILGGTFSRYDHSFQATSPGLSPKDLTLPLGNNPRTHFPQTPIYGIWKAEDKGCRRSFRPQPVSKDHHILEFAGICLWGEGKQHTLVKWRKNFATDKSVKGLNGIWTHRISMNRRKVKYCYNWSSKALRKALLPWQKGFLFNIFRFFFL